MKAFNFSTPTRQSAKGIFVVVFVSLVAQVKRSIPLLVIFVLQWFRRPEVIKAYAWQIGLALGFLLVFLLIRSILTYKNFLFYIEGDQFHLRQGIFKKSKIVIPTSKIQNIHISQNLLQQLLKVVQVNIDSSGDEGSEIQIRALSRDHAQALRTELLGTKTIVEKQLEEEVVQEEEVIISLNPLDLLLIGLTQNHLRNLMIVIVAIIGFYRDIEDLLKGFGTEVDDKVIADLFNANVILASLMMLLLALILGFLYSIVTIFIANFNFSIKKTDEALVIQKGLFNKNQFTVQLKRIQSVEYVTNFLKAIFGMHTVRLYQTATARKTEKKNGLVGLRNAHLRRMEGLIFGFNPLVAVKKQKPNAYYRTRLLFRAFFIVVGVNCYFLFLGNYLLFYLNIVLIPLALVLVYLQWKKSYYYFDERYFVLGSGGIDTVTSIAEIHNIQSVKYTQTIFQKRRNLVDLHVNTASNKFTAPCIDSEEATNIYNYLLYKIESSPIAWN